MSLKRSGGFTLVELVIVIMVTAVLATVIAIYMRPAFDAYADSRSRSELASTAAVSLQRMAQDVAMAVPNSIRSAGPTCFDVVPSSDSGRLRMGMDVTDGAAPLDTSQPISQVDVLTPMAPAPAAGSWLVVGNETASDLYGGSTRTAVSGASAPPARAFGTSRLNLNQPTQFPQGYSSGRFYMVSTQGVVSYACTGLGAAQGRGTGTLWRLSGQAFSALPSACPAVSNATPGAQRLATGLSSCSFSYDTGAAASLQYGLLQLQLGFTSGSETATLVDSLQVLNMP